MLLRLSTVVTVSLSLTPQCFADEAPREQEIICMDQEDQAPCRYSDDNGVTRSGNCEDQICIPHCPESAAEGSECTFIFGSGEVNQGTCDEGICNTSGSRGGGSEATGGEMTGGVSLSDVLGTRGGSEVESNSAAETDQNEEVSSDSEDEGCQQGTTALNMIPILLGFLMILAGWRRRSLFH